MKAVILAGGLGARLGEETQVRPKPMVEIGGMPILWHIMKIYSHFSINEFIICCGYKGFIIKEYFKNYFLHMSDITLDTSDNSILVHKKNIENWKITLINTGLETKTGGRLLRTYDFVKDEDSFCFTYGDGLSNLNISKSIKFHKNHGKVATLTATYAPGRFGAITIKKKQITKFQEKPLGDGNMINGGFFVLKPKVFDYLSGDNTIFEQEPLSQLANDGELMAFEHKGFWQPMDTLADKQRLEEMWKLKSAPWKLWKN